MIKFARYLLNPSSQTHNNYSDHNSTAHIYYVKKYLYDSKWPNTKSLIKRDLEYICSCWNHKCFDLWEEIIAHHFYTAMVQAKALKMGAEFAKYMNDVHASDHYLNVHNKITKLIREKFYKNGRIISSIDINNGYHSVHSEHSEHSEHSDHSDHSDYSYHSMHAISHDRYLDSSILLAFIHSGEEYNVELANTMADMVEMFRAEYPINQLNNLMLTGRYKGDVYYKGNPWVLTTATLSYFLSTLDLNKLDQSELQLSDKFYKIFGKTNEELKINGENIIQSLMKIEAQNRSSGLSFAEQIDKNNFSYLSADRLTWNYVEMTRAIDQLYK